ncbi:hypothetical protein SKAU_G00228240 [Synaphobranchus kaupii]|uniref:PWWP domain-containing protein n=1 Tax=Synaphobranchus kaupii TaxID=118154 RepID=A0A9Q1F547_SYNKA|nr:hypothetical protein SKAU_G00228240 [Synaphobranchus kaupii]
MHLSTTALKATSSYAYKQQDAPCYSPLRRLQHLTSMVSGPELGLAHRDSQVRGGSHTQKPMGLKDLGSTLAHISPPLPTNKETGTYLPGQDSDINSLPQHPPGLCLDRPGQVSNGTLHFESTLFENGEEQEDEEGEVVEDKERGMGFKGFSKKECKRKASHISAPCGSGVDLTAARRDVGACGEMGAGGGPPAPSASKFSLDEVEFSDECSDSDFELPSLGSAADSSHGGADPCISTNPPTSPRKKPPPEVKFSVGDLVWSKFNRRPWWPCQVIADPQDGTHTRMKEPSRRPCRQYFLRTFGDTVDQAWVPGKATCPFVGGHEFEDLPVLRRRGRQKDKNYKYTIAKRFLEAWKVSVQEAEALLPETLNKALPVTPTLKKSCEPVREEQVSESPLLSVTPPSPACLFNGKALTPTEPPRPKETAIKKAPIRKRSKTPSTKTARPVLKKSPANQMEKDTRDSPYSDIDSVPRILCPKREKTIERDPQPAPLPRGKGERQKAFGVGRDIEGNGLTVLGAELGSLDRPLWGGRGHSGYSRHLGISGSQ